MHKKQRIASHLVGSHPHGPLGVGVAEDVLETLAVGRCGTLQRLLDPQVYGKGAVGGVGDRAEVCVAGRILQAM